MKSFQWKWPWIQTKKGKGYDIFTFLPFAITFIVALQFIIDALRPGALSPIKLYGSLLAHSGVLVSIGLILYLVGGLIFRPPAETEERSLNRIVSDIILGILCGILLCLVVEGFGTIINILIPLLP